MPAAAKHRAHQEIQPETFRVRVVGDEHQRPGLDCKHFHAVYSGSEAAIEIVTLRIMKGTLPPRALAMTIESATEHRSQLLEDWELCAMKQTPKQIQPLV